MEKKCCICGQTLGALSVCERSYHNRSFRFCNACEEAFEKIESGKERKVEAGTAYIHSKLQQGGISPEAVPMVKELLGEKVSDEEIETAVATVPVVHKDDLSGYFATILGTVLLFLAVILYIISVSNEYGVANIQATVLSAATFISSMILYAAALVIKAIKSRD